MNRTKAHSDLALANWFGRDGEVLTAVEAALRGCRWIGVPFAGGMGALARFQCNQGVATDLHHHVMNLAAVAADPTLRDVFMDRLALTPCHANLYREAQERCLEREYEQPAYVVTGTDLFGSTSTKAAPFPLHKRPDVGWAVDYFVVSWMGRGGNAGQESEFTADGFSVRFTATGGSSSSRWRSALASFPAMGEVLKRWTFVCMDAFHLLDQAYDVERKAVKKGTPDFNNGLYVDSPFPTVGEPYRHTFAADDHRRLAESLTRFRRTRLCVRFHEDPYVRSLYPEEHWHCTTLTSRAQGNTERTELLFTNRSSIAATAAA